MTEVTVSSQITVVKVSNDNDLSTDRPVVEENTSLPFVSQPDPIGNLRDSKATTIVFISIGIVVAVILALVVIYFMFKSSKYSNICFLREVLFSL